MSQLLLLPESIKKFLEALHNHDEKGLTESFHPDAVLIDDGKSFKGHPAIRAWIHNSLIAPMATLSVKNATSAGDMVDLNAIMDGDYLSYGLSEPFQLFFRFTTTSASINSLTISDLDPEAPSMLAVYASKRDPENPLASLRIGRRAMPEIPDGWVRVKVSAVAINWHDLFTLMGVGFHKITFPMILGAEGCGTLDDGTEVVIYPVMGDPNFSDNITLDPMRNVPSEISQGTLAEYVVVPRGNAIPRPKELPLMSAAVLGISWLTAYRMIFTRSGVRAGQKILVQGSSGGVATALIQLGSAAGMRVWCTGRSEEKRQLAVALGAEKTFVAGEKLPELVDAVFDMSGEATWKHSLMSVRPGGAIVVSGIHTGANPPAELFHLFTNQIEVKGTYVGTLDEFKDLISFVIAKGIKPHVGQILPIEKVEEGLRNIYEGKTNGKIVITI